MWLRQREHISNNLDILKKLIDANDRLSRLGDAKS